MLFAYRFLGSTLVVYHNPDRRDTFGPDRVHIQSFRLLDAEGKTIETAGSIVPLPLSRRSERARSRGLMFFSVKEINPLFSCGNVEEKGTEEMAQQKKTPGWTFLEEGIFLLNQPEATNGLYFPLANEGGDDVGNLSPAARGQQDWTTPLFVTPVSVADLHNTKAARNFWFFLDGCGPWSVTGNTPQQSSLGTRVPPFKCRIPLAPNNQGKPDFEA